MNEIAIFQNPEFGEVRTITEDGQTLFCGSDVAKALGYANPRKALIDHCKGVTKRDTPTAGGIQQMFENVILPKRRPFSTQELLNWIGLGPCENISVLPQALRDAAAAIAHGFDQYSDLLFFLNSAMHSGDSIVRYRLTPL